MVRFRFKFEPQYNRKMKRKEKFRNSDKSRKELKEVEKKYKKADGLFHKKIQTKNEGL